MTLCISLSTINHFLLLSSFFQLQEHEIYSMWAQIPQKWTFPPFLGGGGCFSSVVLNSINLGPKHVTISITFHGYSTMQLPLPATGTSRNFKNHHRGLNPEFSCSCGKNNEGKRRKWFIVFKDIHNFINVR